MTKYHAKPTVVDRIRFHSKAEARRYCELMLLGNAGEISELELQPRYQFSIDGKEMFAYLADFAYFDLRSGQRVIEDVKGVRTKEYKLKKKIIEAFYGITITEIEA